MREIDLAGDVRLKGVKIIHKDSGAVKDPGGRFTQVELLIGAGIISKGSSMTQLLELLRNC